MSHIRQNKAKRLARLQERISAASEKFERENPELVSLIKEIDKRKIEQRANEPWRKIWERGLWL